jgi:hypothetical protein
MVSPCVRAGSVVLGSRLVHPGSEMHEFNAALSAALEEEAVKHFTSVAGFAVSRKLCMPEGSFRHLTRP